MIDTAKRNNLSWDAVISCEGIGKYKALPEAYLTAARWLQLKPEECCMVACHNFDLDAAKNAGFKTAFVRRPDEWGAAGPPDPEPNPNHDIVAAGFPDLARQLEVQIQNGRFRRRNETLKHQEPDIEKDQYGSQIHKWD